jgi:hypothetical protein
MFNKLKNKLNRTNQGFSAVEYMIAAIFLAIVFINLGKLLITGVKNGQFVKKLADVGALASQKTSELFNDTPNQVKLIPNGQTQAGSIDPNSPMPGYFDLLNESGCLINSPNPNPNPNPNPKGKDGRGIDPIDDIDKGQGTVSTLDCSKSTVPSPSNSTIAKFRRQWLIKRNFPTTNDVTSYVIVVKQDTNDIVRIRYATKSDGVVTK